MNPKVTIVIPFYNDPYAYQAISSALAQTYPNVEIIVVDDGSNRYGEIGKIVPLMNRVLYMRKPNGGTASALNYGIRRASGDYIAWLSSDDLFYPHKLAVQIPFMLERQAEISFCSFDLMDENGLVTQTDVTPRFADEAALCSAMLTLNPINGCTVVMSVRLLEEIGLFNEALPYTHDYDLWFRIMLAGYRFAFVDEPLIGYRWHPQMGTVRHWPSIQLEIEQTRERYRRSMTDYIHKLGGQV
ncbi:glycosyltransferase [Paenibacillus doosanensis]|uniref:glycosyltransferase n=1 Tax=Paenibacillus doosanensis TaxID=1229154 RepID=UPI00217F4035|nr:glycosyltransferase [Paenibacillus doosanensis]MCS7458831.1 glycosyltransferase [Paenibacillus doosanensis]